MTRQALRRPGGIRRGSGSWLNAGLVAVCVLATACGGPGSAPPAERVDGVWTGEVLLSGGPVLFELVVTPGDDPPGRVEPAGVELAAVQRRGRAWVLSLDGPATDLVGRLSPDGDKLEGFWRPAPGAGPGPELPFVARRGAPAPATPAAGLRGEWVAAGEGDGAGPDAVVALRLEDAGGGAVATVETAARRWEGLLAEGVGDRGLRIHGFDGRDALLVQLEADPSRTLEGWLWTATGEAVEVTLRPSASAAGAVQPGARRGRVGPVSATQASS